MSKAKEKAKELVDRFMQVEDTIGINGRSLLYLKEAKQCALICVDEILQEIEGFPYACKFWEEVKNEIEKL